MMYDQCTTRCSMARRLGYPVGVFTRLSISNSRDGKRHGSIETSRFPCIRYLFHMCVRSLMGAFGKLRWHDTYSCLNTKLRSLCYVV
jgi:hypothetical protein